MLRKTRGKRVPLCVCLRLSPQGGVQACSQWRGPSHFLPLNWACTGWVRDVWASVPLCLEILRSHSGSTNMTVVTSRLFRRWQRELKAQTGWHIWEMRADRKPRPGSRHHVSAWLASGQIARSPGSAWARGTYLLQAEDKALEPLWQADGAGRWLCLPLSEIWTRSGLLFLVNAMSSTRHSSSGMPQDHMRPLDLQNSRKALAPILRKQNKLKSTHAQIHVILYVISGGSWACPFSKTLVSFSAT